MRKPRSLDYLIVSFLFHDLFIIVETLHMSFLFGKAFSILNHLCFLTIFFFCAFTCLYCIYISIYIYINIFTRIYPELFIYSMLCKINIHLFDVIYPRLSCIRIFYVIFLQCGCTYIKLCNLIIKCVCVCPCLYGSAVVMTRLSECLTQSSMNVKTFKISSEWS